MLMNARDTTEYLYDLIQEQNPKVVLFYADHQYKMLDWKLNGSFSKLIQSGVISGDYGSVSLVPILWSGKQLSFYIVGLGEHKAPDAHLKGIARGL